MKLKWKHISKIVVMTSLFVCLEDQIIFATEVSPTINELQGMDYLEENNNLNTHIIEDEEVLKVEIEANEEELPSENLDSSQEELPQEDLESGEEELPQEDVESSEEELETKETEALVNKEIGLRNWGSGTVTIDGYYEDWNYIPHGILTYSSWNGAGNHDAALYIEDNVLYGHIRMNDLYGTQLRLNTMYISVNGTKVQFSAHYANADGTIDWSKDSQIYQMSEGRNDGLSLFNDGYPVYNLGDAILTVYDGNGHSRGDEYEFVISLEGLSQLVGIPVESMSEFTLEAPNVGGGSIHANGTSTGPIVGLVACIGSVGLYRLYGKRKKVAYE